MFTTKHKLHRRKNLVYPVLSQSPNSALHRDALNKYIAWIYEYIVNVFRGGFQVIRQGRNYKWQPFFSLISWKVSQIHCFSTPLYTKKYFINTFQVTKEKKVLRLIYLSYAVCWFRIGTFWRIIHKPRFKDLLRSYSDYHSVALVIV